MSQRLIYPFTQIYEDVQKEMRETSTEAAVEQKFMRRVNHVYMFDIPGRWEWDWLRKVSSISLSGVYDTGTVDISAAGSSVTGNDTVWTSSHDGWLLKVSGDDEIYTFTYVSGTSGTITPAFGDTAADDATYTLYKTIYNLPSDFSKFPICDPRLYYHNGGSKIPIKWYSDRDFMKRSTYVPNTFPTGWREYPQPTSLGLSRIELTAPVSDDMTAWLEYIMQQAEMYEITDTAKTGSTTTKLLTTTNLYGKVSAGMYTRVDADAEWTQITAVATDTTTGNGITIAGLRTAPDNTDPITICSAPNMPAPLQEALFYGACMLTALEQNNQAAVAYSKAYIETLGMDMARKNRKRYGDQRLGLYSRR